MATKTWIQLIRPFTLLPPMLGMLTGAFAALGVRGHLWPEEGIGLNIILGSLMAGCLNAASNALNQVCDLEQDRINKPERPIPSGAMTSAAALWCAALFYGLSLALSWFIDCGAGRECFWIVAFTAFLTFAYSSPPFRWRRFGWRANFTVALPRGMLLKVAGWSCVAPVFSDAEPWILGSVFFFFLLGATTTKDFADREGDAEAGVRNLPVKLGARRAVQVTAPFFFLPWLLLPLSAVLPEPLLSAPASGLVALGLMTAIYGYWIVRLLLADTEALSQKENHPAWAHMYRLMMGAQIGSALIYWAPLLRS